MSEKPTDVKHITATCPVAGCDEKAFVQVLIFEDQKTQAKVDARAKRKLKSQLSAWHKEGQHGR